MIKCLKLIFSIGIILCIAGWGPLFSSNPATDEPTSGIGSSSWIDREFSLIRSQASNLDPTVLRLGLKAYAHARQRGLDSKQLLTIIDYSKPSNERRLFVVDMRKAKILFNTWVAHGKNSGNLSATSFSNQPGSLKSSIGVFLTDEGPYFGGHGISIRLIGLERGINDNAYRRNVVVHGAWYAESNVARRYGQLGRSWGCPAVSEKVIKPLVDTIKHKTLVFAYSSDRRWLRQSSFLS